MKSYKKDCDQYAYSVYSHRIKSRLGKSMRGVEIFPIYGTNEKDVEITGIEVIDKTGVDWIQRVITTTLHLW